MDTTALRIAPLLLTVALAACANDHRPDLVSRETDAAAQSEDGSHVTQPPNAAGCTAIGCSTSVDGVLYAYSNDCRIVRCSTHGGAFDGDRNRDWDADDESCTVVTAHASVAFVPAPDSETVTATRRNTDGTRAGEPVTIRCGDIPPSKDAAPAAGARAKPDVQTPVAQDAGTDPDMPIADSGSDAAETDDSAVADSGLPIADAGSCTPVTCEKPAGFATYSYWTDCDTIRCSVRGIPGVNDGPEAETDWTAGGDCEFEASGFVATFAIEPGRGLVAHLRQTLNDGGLSPLGNGLALCD